MAEQNLYSRLKRLFSTNVIVRNVGGKQLKVADTDNIQSFVSNAMRDRYSRVHAASSYGTSMNSYGSNMSYQTQRLTLFRDYDLMDMDPIIASALDIYADESTIKNEYGDILTIECENSRVKEVLHNLFYDVINIEFNLWWWVRNLVKYGDFFLFLEISPEYGVYNVLPLSVYDTVRIEGEHPENPHFVRFETFGTNGIKQSFDNYEVTHFRLASDGNFLPYGKSMVENSRRSFRQLTMMEDAMMIHRIMRAPEKRVFKVDIGNIPPGEVDAYMTKLLDKMKKVPFIDPSTGDYNLRYNMQNLLEDFLLPVRGKDSGTSIENLGGLEYSPIDDIEYLRNRMMAGLKIPKAFLGYDENVNGKATLAAEDVRFARTIERIQRVLVSELTKIAHVHLFAQGFTDEELVSFSLSLTNPSTISEQEKINLWTQKVALVAQIQGTKMLSSDWMYDQVFHIPADEADKERQRVVEDAKRMYRVAQIEQGQSDPAKFGFPQDEEPPEDPNAAGGAPPGAPPAQGGAPSPDQGGSDPAGAGAPVGGPQSVDDLPTAAELGLEEDADGRGAPRKGSVYGQDSHVRGRDPLGFKERYKAMQVGTKRAPSPKSPLSLEMRNVLTRMVKPKATLMTEATKKDSDTGTFMDEIGIFSEDEGTR
jgi:hypothetical protein